MWIEVTQTDGKECCLLSEKVFCFEEVEKGTRIFHSYQLSGQFLYTDCDMPFKAVKELICPTS